MAQRMRLRNIPYIDQRRLHYGFLLGLDAVDLNIEHRGADVRTLNDGTEWYASTPSVDVGFCVGLMGDLALTEHLNVRCAPTLHFVSRSIAMRGMAYGEDGAPTELERKQSLKSSYMEIPFTLKVATHRLNNYRPYMQLGTSLWVDWSHEEETPLVFRRFDASLIAAIGCDTYLPFFKFCPELRFSYGLLDMVDHSRHGLKDPAMMQYTRSVRRATNKSVSLVFYFE